MVVDDASTAVAVAVRRESVENESVADNVSDAVRRESVENESVADRVAVAESVENESVTTAELETSEESCLLSFFFISCV